MEENNSDLQHSVSGSPVSSTPKHGILRGRFGLRAGWGMLLFFVSVFLMTLVANLLTAVACGVLKPFIAAQHSGGFRFPVTPRPISLQDGLTFLGMLGVCWLLARGEHRRLGVYGLGSSRLADFLPGTFWGLTTLSLLILILHSLHLLVFDARLLTASSAFAFGIKWLIGFLMVGLAEEYMLRGYLQYTLMRGIFGPGESTSPARARAIAFWIAAILMSILFGAGHLGNAHENPMGLVMVFVAGMVFSYALWRTGSLWWAVGFHMAWDWAQSFLYGVPDSGQISVGRLFQTHPVGNRFLSGDIDGPEGSVYVIPVLLLVVIIIRYTTKPGVQPPLEPVAAHAEAPLTIA
jgi:membrane protease YdiL (CAAX protease family)